MIYPPEKADDTVFVTTRATTTSSLNPFRDTTASGSTTYSPPPGPPPAYVDREFIQPPNPLLQVPKAGPSNRSPSPSSSGFKLAGTTAVDVLNPPPPCFARPPPYNPLMSATFPPCTLISIDAKLENGFPALAPPSSLQPHPFIVHDVKEEDWVRLLNDIKAVGKLSPMNRIVSNVAPLALGVGFFPGLFVTRALERGMKDKKHNVVSDIIDHWNFYFFHPRQLEVALSQGPVVHASMMGTGTRQETSFRSDDRYSSDSSSSSSDSDSDDKKRRGMGRRERREERRQMKQERRERRTERRQEKRERRSERRERKGAMRENKNEKWSLTISFRPLAR